MLSHDGGVLSSLYECLFISYDLVEVKIIVLIILGLRAERSKRTIEWKHIVAGQPISGEAYTYEHKILATH